MNIGSMLFHLLVVLVCFPFCSGIKDVQIQNAAEQIWAADSHRFHGSDIRLNKEGPRLFAYVNEGRMRGIPIYQKFLDLNDFYEPNIGTPDFCGSACRRSQNAFIDEMFNGSSRPMQMAHRFLVSHGLAPSSVSAFKLKLREYWFQQYSRSHRSAIDSSGFEHVFLGEIRQNGHEVTGLHNWIRAYYEEKDGGLHYVRHKSSCQPSIEKFSFNWNGAFKPTSSMWIGTSPEVEMSLYTLCYMTRPNSVCNLRLDGNPITMRVFVMNHLTPKTVGSVYPECSRTIWSNYED